MRHATRASAVLALSLLLLGGGLTAPRPARAADGQLAIGVHVTVAPRWLDPAETESAISPFMILYAIHDAPREADAGRSADALPGRSRGRSRPTASTYDFVLRAAKFHNGDPVTAEDVKFSFERYRRRRRHAAQGEGQGGPGSSIRGASASSSRPRGQTS